MAQRHKREPSPKYRQSQEGVLNSNNNNAYQQHRQHLPSNFKTQEPVEVYCRIRHVSGVVEDTESSSGEDRIRNLNNIAACTLKDSKTVSLSLIDKRERNTESKIHYSFTKAFGPKTGQTEMFETVCKPNVNRLIAGGNALLFAYGVTSSGKTYTMMGSREHPGILPRTLNMLFSSIQNYQTNKNEIKPFNFNTFTIQGPADAARETKNESKGYPNLNFKRYSTGFDDSFDYNLKTVVSDEVKTNNCVKYGVFITFVEIYNDRVYDLLDDNSSLKPKIVKKYTIYQETKQTVPEHVNEVKLGHRSSAPLSKKVREDITTNSYVDGVCEIEVKSIKEAFEQYNKGKEKRRLAQTELNFTSSRSHSIFQIKLVHAPFDIKNNTIYQDDRLLQVSRLALVDLAGSERVSRTGAMGATLAEASNINSSLMVLRQCIEGLRKKQRGNHQALIPFRQKKIVRLFRPFFEGEGKITILICVSPRRSDANETEHVLSFAESAKKVSIETKETELMDIEMISRKKNEFDKIDNIKMEKISRDKKDLQKRIRYKIPPAGYNPNISDESTIVLDEEESGISSGVSFQPTLECPDLGPSNPPTDCTNDNDEKTFPTLLKWILLKQKNFVNFRDKAIQNIPQHIKNIKLLTNQYESHMSNFKNLQMKYDSEHKENDNLKRCNRKLDAKINIYNKKIGELERENRENNGALTEKEASIRDLRRQVKSTKQDLDKQINLVERRHQQETNKKIRDAVHGSNQQLKQYSAKLAQVKHVLGKSNFRKEEFVESRSRDAFRPKNTSRPTTAKPKYQEAKTQPSRPISSTTNRINNNENNPLVGQEKALPISHPSPLRRRSKSEDRSKPYLSHKPQDVINTKTILKPKVKVTKHVNNPNVKDLKTHSKYLLTAQNLDSSGEMQTQYLKGEITKTNRINDGASGIAVHFTDMEILKTKCPAKYINGDKENKFKGNFATNLSAGVKRNSDQFEENCQFENASNVPSQWTDVQTRCGGGLGGGDLKKTKMSPR